MRKKIQLLMIVFGVMLSAGCSSNPNDKEAENRQFTMKTMTELREEVKNLEDHYVNLNLSETVISIPDVDEISDVLFPITYTLEEQEEKFQKNIRKYANLDENMDLTPYMNMMYWDFDENDRLIIPYNEATDEQWEQIQYLSYNDGKNSQLLVFSNYMLEMGNYELPISLTQETRDYTKDAYGYRGRDLGQLLETYCLPQDDISGVSYTLSDGEMTLQDAVDYVEKHVKEDYYFVGSEFLEYHVCKAEVRKLNDSLYYYQFNLRPSYEGVFLNNERGGITVEEENMVPIEVFGDDHKVSLFCSDQLGFVWSSCHSYERVEEQECHTEFISLEDACTLLSNHISKKKDLGVSSIELIYQTEFRYESQEKKDRGEIESIYCHPVYQFFVGSPSVSGLFRCYFNVDAITGEIIYVEG